MPRVQQAAVYVDSVSTLAVGAVTRPLLVNRFPEASEQDVPINNPIEIILIDVGAAGLATVTHVDVTTLGEGTVHAFIQGTGFDSTYATDSSFSIEQSPGSSVDDEHIIQLVRTAPWLSQETVTVRVQAQTVDGNTLDQTYTFGVEDLTEPYITNVVSVGLKTLVVTFSEPILADTSTFGALRVREISGRVTPTAPYFIEAENAGFTTESVSDFITISGAANAVNNTSFEVASVSDGQNVTTVETDVATETSGLDVFCWTGPYKLVAVMEPAMLIPTFIPAITAATVIDDITVQLTLEQQLSPGRPYQLVIHNVGDLADPVNVTSEMTFDFEAETLPNISGRRMHLWEDLTPEINKREDSTGDNQRFIRCLDEITQLLIADTDTFGNLLDVDSTPSDTLDVLLVHLGNPFTFLNDELTKRKTINGLVQTFKDSGVDRGIENAVQFFLGIPVVVQPFNLLSGWILGVSSLGFDTVLGTNVDFLIYSFEIVSDTALTQEQRDIITEITNVIKPSHTHFVRFVEP